MSNETQNPKPWRRSVALYAAVAMGSLAVGVAGTWLALQTGIVTMPAQAVPAAPQPAPTTGEQPNGGAGSPPRTPARWGAMAGMDMGGGQEPAAESTGVYISPARQQLIGVRTAELQARTLDATIRTVGTLAYDETRVTEIHPKISGWVERVFVDFVGKPVRRGEPLLTIYSPDLVATQNEYLLALRAQRQLGDSAFAETRAGAASLLAATGDRLRLWDITDAQIAELERTGQARRTLTLYSPFDGIVLERNTFAGQYITPDTSTAKIADLSTIWAIAQIFEYEARTVKPGDRAQIEFPYGQSTRRLSGRVTFVYPDINPETRRARVRIEFSNPGLELKPESYVTVVLRRTAGKQLALPKEALLDNGARQYAILARPDGYFEPREIEVGEPVDQFYPVVKGLSAGDRVVTSAQFLIDSETNLQAALQSMSMNMPGMDMGGREKPVQSAPAAPAAPPSPVVHPTHKD
ncbi:MAG: efflux RND transporter periplasmic adaptor subunit [Acidobacteria bacterium]|nr:efflux RND transporter periplasmic adaptor subunit [Acidobacteriota bacterium]